MRFENRKEEERILRSHIGEGEGVGAVMLSSGFGRGMARIFSACYMMFVPLNKLLFPDVGLTLNGIACSLTKQDIF